MLVHCFVGVSRSATISIAYLMRLKRMTYEKTLKLVKSKRPDVMPNVGFIQQLIDYEDTVLIKKKGKAS